MRLGDAAHIRRGVVPPLLVQQKALVEQVEGRLLPGRVTEAPVLGQRLDATGCSYPRHRALQGILSKTRALFQRLLPKLPLFARRRGHVDGPIRPHRRQRRRREAACHPGDHCAGGMIENIAHRGGRVGISEIRKWRQRGRLILALRSSAWPHDRKMPGTLLVAFFRRDRHWTLRPSSVLATRNLQQQNGAAQYSHSANRLCRFCMPCGLYGRFASAYMLQRTKRRSGKDRLEGVRTCRGNRMTGNRTSA